jgi:hypothetical protein
MAIKGFLGRLTATTAAGVQPIGSVFNAVPTADYLLGRDMPQMLPSLRSHSSQRAATSEDHFAQPCGCGA